MRISLTQSTRSGRPPLLPCKTKHRKLTASICVALLTATAGCSPQATSPSEAITQLKMADSFSLTHPVGKTGTTVFLENIENRGTHTQPPLSIDYFASGQMGKQADIPSILRSGVVDLAVVSPAYVSSTFPLAGVADLPGFGNDSCTTAAALKDITAPGTLLYETEFEPMKFRPLWTGSIPGYEAMNNSPEIANPETLKGQVLRSTGGALDRVISQLGAAGVAMPIGDLYEAISRGTVEGTLASPISITPYGLQEVISHSTLGADQGSFTFIYGINTDTWQRLSTDQQNALEDASKKAQASVCQGLNKARDKSIAKMRESGVDFHDVGPYAEDWNSIAEPVKHKWVEAGESLGLPAHKVMQDFEKAIKNQKGKS